MALRHALSRGLPLSVAKDFVLGTRDLAGLAHACLVQLSGQVPEIFIGFSNGAGVFAEAGAEGALCTTKGI